MKIRVVGRSSWASAAAASESSSPAVNLAPRQFSSADFEVVSRESGSEKTDLPIFSSRTGLIKFDADKGLNSEHEQVPGVPGALLISNVLSPAECSQLMSLTNTMGYDEDAPVSLAHDIRHNENCVWIADDEFLNRLLQRCGKHLPQIGGGLAGINARCRCYRYSEGDFFAIHRDGGWPGSGVVDGKLEFDRFGDRFSQMTFLLYLNDDFDGGQTTFYTPVAQDGDVVDVFVQAVEPKQGAALCFFHGTHELSALHESASIGSGTKFIIRSDVLFFTEEAKRRRAGL
eukprot:g876.t1